ncbi:MAG: GTP-sensing pleiotropic transcriptional regulator CodY [Firmicutes bacterium]|nr:GTP-sensing pleiotropic transcriptional regulator CodY [Bacillota bacterium]
MTQYIQNIEESIDWSELAEKMQEFLGSSGVCLADRNGKVLGCSEVVKSQVAAADSGEPSALPDELNAKLLALSATGVVDHGRLFGKQVLTAVPVIARGQRLGTLLLLGAAEASVDDLVIAEYASTLMGMAIFNAKDRKRGEEAREKAMAQMAISSLSYSELVALNGVFSQLGGKEGFLVASRVADESRITRSVIVNALRKLESANLIRSRSLGMKGTYIKILNDYILPELDKYKLKQSHLLSPIMLEKQA